MQFCPGRKLTLTLVDFNSHSMKKTLILSIMVLACLMAKAQENSSRGYRGYADLGYTIGVGYYDLNSFEISTTHGYQLSSYFFIGAGVGFHFMQEYKTPDMNIPMDIRDSKVSIPFYVDFRGTFGKRRVAPFVDLKLGYFVTNGDAFYSHISAGVRIRTVEKQAVTIGIGGSYESLRFETFDQFVSPGLNMDYSRTPQNYYLDGVAIMVGYEF